MYSWVVPVLPYVDNQELYNQWTFSYTLNNTPAAGSYIDGYGGQLPPTSRWAKASNWKIGSTAIGILRCPDDNTYQPDQGNLSYAVNGGFALWHAVPYGWAGSAIDGQASTTTQPMKWIPGTATYLATMGVQQKMGVMFLESDFAQGLTPTKVPWNIRSNLGGMADGASSTLLLSENTLTGFGSPSAYSVGLETNWASPMPNFSTFIGSSNVCSTTVPIVASTTLNCTLGQSLLQPTGDNDGPAWTLANKAGTYENVDFGQNLTIEGSFPFTNTPTPAAPTWPSATVRSGSSMPRSTPRVRQADHPVRQPAASVCASRCPSPRMPSRSDRRMPGSTRTGSGPRRGILPDSLPVASMQSRRIGGTG